ncbi:YunC family protein [Sporolactobacillus inulinus]|jgi:uncharacterized protein YunC (DUF1805 family)|uniref:DUF1805 domain-containing protein n=1 Tax=Sporolactobacillus inulinus CASD TaxID=1069536 RepID=A0A0U1QNM2_9BACL|nr:DUF1805 domain-containing protein [Sporolactobacillus inulinus]KLI02400.1 hypothetical protein SINU_08320 [Sporolactobacillus inulinus CASD]GEB77888.1 hypothetical protein SIN01_22330 [Sporolactobacillus inulinus]
MIHVQPFTIDGRLVQGISVSLPKTTLLIITGASGYIMCGALDVGLLNDKLADRDVRAGKAVGVRTLEDLLHAPLAEVTVGAEKIGVHPGMSGIDALKKMA